MSGTINWVLAVYFINVVCIAANWVVYFRNCAIDRERDRLRKEEDAQDAMAQAHGRAITVPSCAAWSFQAFLAFARALAYIYI